MSKIAKMYRAFLKAENLEAGSKSFDAFTRAMQDYNYLCKIEKIAEKEM